MRVAAVVVVFLSFVNGLSAGWVDTETSAPQPSWTLADLVTSISPDDPGSFDVFTGAFGITLDIDTAGEVAFGVQSPDTSTDLLINSPVSLSTTW